MREVYDAEGHYVPNRNSFKTNVLLQKSHIGKARPTTFDLPNEEFCYGRKNERGGESAGQVLKWDLSTQNNRSRRSEDPSKLDFVAINRKTLHHGCLDATSQRKFRKDNIILQSEKRQTKTQQSNVDKSITYGRKNAAQKPFTDLIKNKYQKDFESSQKCVLLEHERAKIQDKIVVRPTKASIGHGAWKTSTNQPSRQDKISNFTMKQFQNIPGKLVINES